MNKFTVLVTTGLLLSASIVSAETVYKCVSASGEVSFQQSQCDVADQATAIEMKTRLPGEPEKPVPATPAEQHYQHLMQQYEAQQRAFEQGTVANRPKRSKEELAVEHLRNKRAAQLGISRKELDRREGWKPMVR